MITDEAIRKVPRIQYKKPEKIWYNSGIGKKCFAYFQKWK